MNSVATLRTLMTLNVIMLGVLTWEVIRLEREKARIRRRDKRQWRKGGAGGDGNS